MNPFVRNSAALLTASIVAATGYTQQRQGAIPAPDAPFTGVVDRDVRNSRPEWPAPATAKAGAPNIVLILVDDVGFSATSVFGGPVDTPEFQRLADHGLKYNQFHVNSLCSPSRSALLTGRNNHQVGFGTVTELAAGYPGYNTLWPKDSASVAEILKDNGYSTAAFGKWHNTPVWQVSPAGPFDRWPTGLGFEYFYGFLSGADNQYYPRIYRNTTPIEPKTTAADGYHFTQDMTEEAVRWLHQHDAVASDKPFFLYFATGATHSPIQVPKEWIEKYKGKFDQGWDKLREQTFERQKKLGVIPANAELTPRPDTLPAWDSLTPDQKKLVSHEAEVYAAYAAHTDYEIGRVLKAIQEEGKSDNTIVLEIFGDNGGSAQGGFYGQDARDVHGKEKDIAARLQTEDDLGSEVFMNHYAAAWAWAFSTPFQGTKEDASHLGGTRDPLVISWPARIKTTGLRSQFAHLNDIAPTLYDIDGITLPETVNGVKQAPLEGSSLAYTFDNPNEPSHHHVQYFATSGNRAIYKDGWWAGDRLRSTWEPNGIAGGEAEVPVDTDLHPWELYNLNDDYSQAHDLASKNPEKLKELQALFDAEAKRNQVYPLLPAYGHLPTAQQAGKKHFIYRDGVDRLTARVAPAVAGKHFTITADVDTKPGASDGVIVAHGSRYGGYTLFVKGGRVQFAVNAFGNQAGHVVASTPLSAGRSHIVVEVVPDGGKQDSTPLNTVSFAVRGALGGTAKLSVNGHNEGQAHLENINFTANETFDIGKDLGSPVSTEYTSPYRFAGTIQAVTLDLE